MSGHTRVELSRSALLSNVQSFRGLCPKSAFMAVLKSNAYGHGLTEFVEILRGQVDWFGVNGIEEAVRIRQLDESTPLLVMGRFEGELLKAHVGSLANGRTQLVLSSIDDIRELHALAPHLPFHLKLDTGMGRLGSHGRALQDTLSFLAEHRDYPWAGVMTHFANVEDVTSQEYALEQLRRFQDSTALAKKAAGSRNLLVHSAASAPALILPASRTDIIRVGISLYGLWPSRETRISTHGSIDADFTLQPVMRWVTKVVHVNDVPRDGCIGYGCSFQADRDMRIAVLPIGYYEGYDRKLSNRAHVSIAGRRARIVGRVCMNMIMVDITDLPEVGVGSEAVLIGSEERDEVSADHLAALADTINYEITTRVNEHFPRVIVP